MKLIINTKTKKQEEEIKKFLHSAEIDFSIVAEDAAVYKTTPKKKLSNKEKQILDNLSQSVDYVKKYREGKTKAKSINQLLNEL